MLNPDKYRVSEGKKLNLADIPSRDDGGLEKEAAHEEFERLHRRLIELESLFYADKRHAMLIVLQGMDTSGKDSTIRRVFSGVGPSAVQVAEFKAPTELELRHDFLWRVHAETPRRGRIVVFNRSHYEDVLIVRVNELVPEERWKGRYEHINAFERLLADEGTVTLKFFLHISREYQREQLQERLDTPEKQWKFSPDDLKVRAKWNDYQEAYEDALRKCSTERAPWYVVPAERRWFRNLLVTRVIVDALESLDLRYPKPTYDPKSIRIDE